MNKLTIAIILTLLFAGCEVEEADGVNREFNGFYKVDSIVSNVAIDVNNDGIASKDFLSEILSEHTLVPTGQKVNMVFNDFGRYAEVRPTYGQINSARTISLNFPVQRFAGIENVIPSGLDYQKGLNFMSYNYINDKDIEVISTENTTAKDGKILNLKLSDQEGFTVQIAIDIYDFKTASFKTTTLSAIYKKIEL
ncbi:MAG: hypothetical protein ACI9V1_001378 [Spirosomataceae bacterium]|jgi:hypothetical protein